MFSYWKNIGSYFLDNSINFHLCFIESQPVFVEHIIWPSIYMFLTNFAFCKHCHLVACIMYEVREDLNHAWILEHMRMYISGLFNFIKLIPRPGIKFWITVFSQNFVDRLPLPFSIDCGCRKTWSQPDNFFLLS